jgi:hypothetical protein
MERREWQRERVSRKGPRTFVFEVSASGRAGGRERYFDIEMYENGL